MKTETIKVELPRKCPFRETDGQCKCGEGRCESGSVFPDWCPLHKSKQLIEIAL